MKLNNLSKIFIPLFSKQKKMILETKKRNLRLRIGGCLIYMKNFVVEKGFTLSIQTINQRGRLNLF